MAQTTEQTTFSSDVLTLAEVAAYLRVSEADIVDLMRRKGMPGRKIGNEWRFLRTAVQEWLRLPEKENFWWKHFGALKEDPYLDQMLDQIYRDRGRPQTEGA
jgi:excisionase family DNA binding protein